MRAPGSLTGRVTLAAVAAVGAALLVASIAVVLVSSRADRSALDRDLRRLAERSAGPAGRLGPPPGFGGGVAGRPPAADQDGDGRSPLGPGDEQFTRLVFANGYIRTGDIQLNGARADGWRDP